MLTIDNSNHRKDYELKIFDRVKEFNQVPKGLSFSIVTRDPKHKFAEVYHRPNQPCYGELRKYKSTHGDECTQPNDSRPGDLYHPFPPGIPEALGFNLYPCSNLEVNTSNFFIESLFGKESPWIKGVGKTEHVHFIYNKGRIVGVVLLDMDIDPTVLVNLLNFNKSYNHQANTFEILVNSKNMSIREAFLAMMSSSSPLKSPWLSPTYDYYFPVTVDVKRFLNQDPHDLTGGSLKNRFDYNRKELHKIFWGKTHILKETYEKMDLDYRRPPSSSENYLKFDDVINAMKEVIKEHS